MLISLKNLSNSQLLVSGLKITILLIWISGCSGNFEMGGASSPKGSAERIAPVETAACWIDSVQQTLSISTDLEALDRVDLTTRVSGVVTEVPLDEGAGVSEGELILRLDPTDLDLAIREKAILLAEATHRLGSARLTLKEVASGADLARVALDRASAERQRLENLFDGDAVKLASEETLEASRYAEQEARINHEKSKHTLEKMDLTLAIEKQGVEKANLAMEMARLDRSRSAIVLFPRTRGCSRVTVRSSSSFVRTRRCEWRSIRAFNRRINSKYSLQFHRSPSKTESWSGARRD
jgi:multidrug efflux pump subunit AcrA (membrane-fusion protein)